MNALRIIHYSLYLFFFIQTRKLHCAISKRESISSSKANSILSLNFVLRFEINLCDAGGVVSKNWCCLKELPSHFSFYLKSFLAFAVQLCRISSDKRRTSNKRRPLTSTSPLVSAAHLSVAPIRTVTVFH